TSRLSGWEAPACAYDGLRGQQLQAATDSLADAELRTRQPVLAAPHVTLGVENHVPIAVRSADAEPKGMGEAQSSFVPSLGCLYFYLEGVSEAEIDLDKVFHRRIEVMIPTPDPVIAGLAKESDMGSK